MKKSIFKKFVWLVLWVSTQCFFFLFSGIYCRCRCKETRDRTGIQKLPVGSAYFIHCRASPLTLWRRHFSTFYRDFYTVLSVTLSHYYFFISHVCICVSANRAQHHRPKRKQLIHIKYNIYEWLLLRLLPTKGRMIIYTNMNINIIMRTGFPSLALKLRIFAPRGIIS